MSPVWEPFPVVGIGASAGGLEAFEQFFSNMPPDSGMAFVLVPHLDPTHKSIMTELLKRYTRMPVYEVKDRMVPQPNSIYVIPPNRDMAIENGKLRLTEPGEKRGLRHPIDIFFRSLAAEFGERSVCVILSGTGSEGTLGLKAVKEEGGLVMAQEPMTAKYSGMPESAISTGAVDYILPPDKMPAELIDFWSNSGPRTAEGLVEPGEAKLQTLRKIFTLVRKQTGHDFSRYKHSTITRRIDRRMAVNQVKHLAKYERLLMKNPDEIELLAREFLIGVTNFFRDKQAFEALRKDALVPLIEAKRPGDSIRVWVPGCSTGEEAYSVAIILRECMEKAKRDIDTQIFATDIDDVAIEKARQGKYPETVSVDVSERRLKRYFVRQGKQYQLKKEIRETVVFALHDIIKDPPFSHLDLVCCRNLLIYMSQDLQKKLFPLFHYALLPGGYVFLGTSESMGDTSGLFSVVDKKNKIYQARKVQRTVEPGFFAAGEPAGAGAMMEKAHTHKTGQALKDATERLLLGTYAPSAVVVTGQGEILYIYGNVGKYLQPAPGEPSHNILGMAREEIRLELGAALRRAAGQNKKAAYDNLSIETAAGRQIFNMSVMPLPEQGATSGLLLVVFEELYVLPPPELEKKKKKKTVYTEKELPARVEELESELKTTREYLQSTIDELQSANEDLKSMNEELQSANEELQSTNEELETSKEELQSVNEELLTVNSELQSSMAELARVNSDMNNLLASTGIATIFLDEDLRIKRYTPATREIIKLIDSDVGRPLTDIATNLRYDNMESEMEQVLGSLSTREKVVRHANGKWYLVRILPYRSVGNVIEGLAVTFIDVTEEKQAREDSEDALAYAQGIVDTVREPLVVLDGGLNVVSANGSFYTYFKVSPEETAGRHIFELGDGQWDISELKDQLGRVLPESLEFKDFAVNHDFPRIGRRRMLLNARRIIQHGRKTEHILLAIEDVTDLRRTR